MSVEYQLSAVLYGLRSAAMPLAGVAIVNSILLMGVHCRENKHRALRIYTLRILLMVIIDSCAAVCALWGVGWRRAADPYVAAILHFVVELYESVVIFSFLQFILACGNGPDRLAMRFADADPQAWHLGKCCLCCSSTGAAADDDVEASSPKSAARAAALQAEGADQPSGDVSQEGQSNSSSDGETTREEPKLEADAEIDAAIARGLSRMPRPLQHLPLVSKLLPPWQNGAQMLRWCVAGTLLYVVIGATMAVVGAVLLVIPGEMYGIKNFLWTVGSTALSAGQAIAIFALAELAVNVREEIASLRPYGKFLSVKFVVFFAFWQHTLLHVLCRYGAFRAWESADLRCGEHCTVEVIQNTLICLEMLIASVIHFYVFPPHDYLRLLAQNLYQHGENNSEFLADTKGFVEVVDIRDIFHTAREVNLPGTPSSRSRGKAPRCLDAGPADQKTGGLRSDGRVIKLEPKEQEAADGSPSDARP